MGSDGNNNTVTRKLVYSQRSVDQRGSRIASTNTSPTPGQQNNQDIPLKDLAPEATAIEIQSDSKSPEICPAPISDTTNPQTPEKEQSTNLEEISSTHFEYFTLEQLLEAHFGGSIQPVYRDFMENLKSRWHYLQNESNARLLKAQNEQRDEKAKAIDAQAEALRWPEQKKRKEYEAAEGELKQAFAEQKKQKWRKKMPQKIALYFMCGLYVVKSMLVTQINDLKRVLNVYRNAIKISNRYSNASTSRDQLSTDMKTVFQPVSAISKGLSTALTSYNLWRHTYRRIKHRRELSDEEKKDLNQTIKKDGWRTLIKSSAFGLQVASMFVITGLAGGIIGACQSLVDMFDACNDIYDWRKKHQSEMALSPAFIAVKKQMEEGNKALSEVELVPILSERTPTPEPLQPHKTPTPKTLADYQLERKVIQARILENLTALEEILKYQNRDILTTNQRSDQLASDINLLLAVEEHIQNRKDALFERGLNAVFYLLTAIGFLGLSIAVTAMHATGLGGMASNCAIGMYILSASNGLKTLAQKMSKFIVNLRKRRRKSAVKQYRYLLNFDGVQDHKKTVKQDKTPAPSIAERVEAVMSKIKENPNTTKHITYEEPVHTFDTPLFNFAGGTGTDHTIDTGPVG